jgi:uncharacterized protein YkwD
MMVRFLLAILLVLGVAACDTEPLAPVGANNNLPSKLYRIKSSDTNRIQFRVLDAVNALRTAGGLRALEFDAALNAAAATHARDMSVQNRPWHFGSDGSSPIDRVKRVGFDGQLIGENISETYETELETLAAWMEQHDTQRVILSKNATRMGFSWLQEENGKIWWVLVIGS